MCDVIGTAIDEFTHSYAWSIALQIDRTDFSGLELRIIRDFFQRRNRLRLNRVLPLTVCASTSAVTVVEYLRPPDLPIVVVKFAV